MVLEAEVTNSKYVVEVIKQVLPLQTLIAKQKPSSFGYTMRLEDVGEADNGRNKADDGRIDRNKGSGIVLSRSFRRISPRKCCP